MEKSKSKAWSPDQIFDIVDRSLRNCGESVAIQMRDRVFVCDLDDLPDSGVPHDGNLRFYGREVTSDDIGVLDGGKPYMESCGPEKILVAEGFRVVRERRSRRK